MTRTLDALTQIKRLYYGATKATVARDVERAIDLLKTLPTEEQRESASVYMDGLAQMRSEWGVKAPAAAPRSPKAPPRASSAARRPRHKR